MVPFGVIGAGKGILIWGCGVAGMFNGLWYRGACPWTTPGSASKPSPHMTANCEILNVIVSRILTSANYATGIQNPRVHIGRLQPTYNGIYPANSTRSEGIMTGGWV